MANLHTEFAAMVLAFATRHKLRQIVDFGAGSGSLLDLLSSLDPSLKLHGIDQRPANVAFDWAVDKWSTLTSGWTSGEAPKMLAKLNKPVLALAVEWLDDIPCTIAQRTPILREIGPDGPTGGLPQREIAWANHWWPTGKNVEIGLTRDEAWESVARSLPPGSILLLIDYGHLRTDRPDYGTFTGFRDGRQREPGYDMNLTAHVAVDSVADAVERIGLQRILLSQQRELTSLLPPLPHGELESLAARSRRHALTSPRIYGDFWWLAHRVPEAGPIHE